MSKIIFISLLVFVSVSANGALAQQPESGASTSGTSASGTSTSGTSSTTSGTSPSATSTSVPSLEKNQTDGEDAGSISIEGDIQTLEDLSIKLKQKIEIAKTLSLARNIDLKDFLRRVLDDIQVLIYLIRELGTTLQSPAFTKSEQQQHRIDAVMRDLGATSLPSGSWMLNGKPGSESPLPDPPDLRREFLQRNKKTKPQKTES